jgi:hypothetical protein
MSSPSSSPSPSSPAAAAPAAAAASAAASAAAIPALSLRAQRTANREQTRALLVASNRAPIAAAVGAGLGPDAGGVEQSGLALLAGQLQRQMLFLQVQMDQHAEATEAKLAQQRAGAAPLFHGSGKGSDIEAHRWLTSLVRWFASAHIEQSDDETRLEVATGALRDRAQAWWAAKLVSGDAAASFGTWALFEAGLRRHFMPLDIIRWAMREREALVSTRHRNVADFTAKFAELDQLIPDADEGPVSRITAYERGLPADYAIKCAEKRFSLLSTATEAMIRHWHLKEGARAAAGPSASLHSTEDAGPSPDFSSASSPAARPRDPVEELRSQVAQLTAMFAGGFRPAQSGGGGGGGGGSSGRSGGRPRNRDGAGTEKRVREKTPGVSDELARSRFHAGECFKCGQKGHLRAECTNPAKGN